MNQRADVVVIGAGLAGLRCAVDLVAAGRDVVLFEARDRVGGRVHSHHFGDGQWCERGADVVLGCHQAVLELAARAGLDLLTVTGGVDPMAGLVDLGGRPAPSAYYGSIAPDVLRWQDVLGQMAAGVDLDELPASVDAELLDATPVSQVLADLGSSVIGRVVIGRLFRSEHMAAPDEVSLLQAAARAARSRAASDATRWRVAGGNDRLAGALAGELDERIRLGVPVAWVDADEGEVVLRSGERWVADHVVSAVPLPVLGRLWSELPAELASVAYGVGGRVSVQVGRRIWRDQGRDGSVLSDRAFGEIWEATDGQSGDAGVLTAHLSSHDGAMLMALPDGERRVVAEMNRLFPGIEALAGERVSTDWTNDPASLGTFVAFGPGQMLAAWHAVRRPYGRLVLAGEHADGWSGSMEGALRSGERAAHLVLGRRP